MGADAREGGGLCLRPSPTGPSRLWGWLIDRDMTGREFHRLGDRNGLDMALGGEQGRHVSGPASLPDPQSLDGPGQKVLAFRKGQTEIREIAEIIGAVDLQHVDAVGRIFGPTPYQTQNPPHSGSPARETPGQSYPAQRRTPKLSAVPTESACQRPDFQNG